MWDQKSKRSGLPREIATSALHTQQKFRLASSAWANWSEANIRNNQHHVGKFVDNWRFVQKVQCTAQHWLSKSMHQDNREQEIIRVQAAGTERMANVSCSGCAGKAAEKTSHKTWCSPMCRVWKFLLGKSQSILKSLLASINRASTPLRNTSQCIIVGPGQLCMDELIPSQDPALHFSQNSGKRMRGWIEAEGILYKLKSKTVQRAPQH